MRITESRLRRIIRSILSEGYTESSELGDNEEILHDSDEHEEDSLGHRNSELPMKRPERKELKKSINW